MHLLPHRDMIMELATQTMVKSEHPKINPQYNV